MIPDEEALEDEILRCMADIRTLRIELARVTEERDAARASRILLSKQIDKDTEDMNALFDRAEAAEKERDCLAESRAQIIAQGRERIAEVEAQAAATLCALTSIYETVWDSGELTEKQCAAAMTCIQTDAGKKLLTELRGLRRVRDAAEQVARGCGVFGCMGFEILSASLEARTK